MQTGAFDYQLGQQKFRGYLAHDESKPGKRPGVLVVHEAWGLGEHAKARAERLAELGYIALAVDMFGEGKQANNVQEGLQWIGALRDDPQMLRARIRTAFDALAALPQVDKARIASIGFCFGGTTSLELARSGAPVAGVVSFHGGLETKAPAEASLIPAKVLVCTGADDPFVPPAQVQAFMEEMAKANVDYQVIVYGGTKHGFTNPKAGERHLNGLEYNKASDERSWNAMQSFFEEIFASRPVAASA